MYTIVVHCGQVDTRIQVNAGENLLEALQKNGVVVPAPCGGHGTCGKCRVQVLSGQAGEVQPEEEKRLGAELEDGWRLACRVKCQDDLTILVPQADVDARVLLDGGLGEVELDPASRKVAVQVDLPTLQDQRSDAQRVCEAVGAKKATLKALTQVSAAVRNPACAMLFRDTLVACEEPESRNLGVAVDVGTTTMAAYLTDLDSGELLGRASSLNPQRAYGGDVISRADHAAQSAENLQELKAKVNGAIEKMTLDMLRKAGLAKEHVRHIVTVGNTIMMHLLLGLDARYIALDACASALMRPAMYGAYHHITVPGKEDAPLDHVYDVVGSLCENNDKFAVQRSLPRIDMGDLVVIHDTGAHGHAMGYNYNGKLRPAEVLLQEDGSFRMIRRAETPADYFATLDF